MSLLQKFIRKPRKISRDLAKTSEQSFCFTAWIWKWGHTWIECIVVTTETLEGFDNLAAFYQSQQQMMVYVSPFVAFNV